MNFPRLAALSIFLVSGLSSLAALGSIEPGGVGSVEPGGFGSVEPGGGWRRMGADAGNIRRPPGKDPRHNLM